MTASGDIGMGGVIGLEIKNNPVGRLRDALNKFKDNARPDTQIMHLWANVFDCSATDTQAIFGGISMMFRLNSEARNATLAYTKDSPAFFFKPFDQVDELLSVMAMHTQWNSVRAMVNDQIMTALEFIEHLLDANFLKSAPGTQDKVVSVLAKIDELIESCLASDLTDELKRLFVRQLQSLRSALFDYRISGPVGLEAALEQAAGCVLRNQAAIKAELTEKNPFVMSFFDVLGKVNDLTSGYQTAAIVLAPVGAMLLNILR